MHVVVVGAGVFGTWTAHHLSAAGLRVTLVDAYGSGNSRSSSGDESRILRCGYGTDEIYSRLAWRSLQLWTELAGRSTAGAFPLWHPCGVLWLSADDDVYTRATRRTLTDAQIPIVDIPNATFPVRYPQLNLTDLRTALLEPGAGVLMARRAVQALAMELVERGVTMVEAQVLPPLSGRLRSVRVREGGEITADLFVFACGAWLPKLFPQILDGRIRATRQVVAYFGTPAGDARFGPERTPAWVDFPSGIYGVPSLEGRGVKVGVDAHGRAIDPDSDDRVIDQESIDTARAWLRRRMPAMANAPVVESRVCQVREHGDGRLSDRSPSRVR